MVLPLGGAMVIDPMDLMCNHHLTPTRGGMETVNRNLNGADFRTRFHRRRARLARRLRDEILRRFAVLWVNRSTTCLSDRGSSLIYAMASVCSSSVSFGGLPLRGLSWRLAGPSCSHFLIHVETVSRSTG